MQDNIDIFRRSLRRNMLQTKSQTAAHKIDNHRPVMVAVAISAYDHDGRTDLLDRFQDGRRTNVTQMPDFIGAFR